MALKYVAIACLLSAIVSAAVTEFYFPKIQTKVVETEHETVKNNVVTVIRTVTKNGETDSTTTITDHTQKSESDSKVAIIAKPADWMASGLYTIDIHNSKPIYGVDIKYRLFGPLFLGGMLDTTGQPRVTLGVTF